MKKITDRLEGFQDRIGRFISLLLIPLILIVVYTAVMRYAFNNAPAWGFEVSVFIFGIYAIISGAYVLKEDGHVRVDILPSLLGKTGNFIIDILSNVMTIIVSAVMLFMGTLSAFASTKIAERSLHQSTFNPPIWWFRWMIPIAALLILIQAVINLIKTANERGEIK